MRFSFNYSFSKKILGGGRIEVWGNVFGGGGGESARRCGGLAGQRGNSCVFNLIRWSFLYAYIYVPATW